MSRTYQGITYDNGQAPASILATLAGQPEANLREDAASAWARARTQAQADKGITLSVVGWYRSLSEQATIFNARYDPRQTGSGPYGDVRWWNGVRYVRVTGAAAAVPGTSNHGWGTAVDVADFGTVGEWDDPRRVATIDILRHHGWTDDEGRDVGEPWHLVYEPSKDQGEEDDMFTDEDRRNLRKAADAAWVKPRIGGSLEGETIHTKISRTDVNVRETEDRITNLNSKVSDLESKLDEVLEILRGQPTS